MVLGSVKVTDFIDKSNRLQVTEKRVSCPLTRISDYSFVLPNFTSKIVHLNFCRLLRLIPTGVERTPWSQIPAWTDRQLLRLEWHPTKP